MATDSALVAEGLRKDFVVAGRTLKAVSGVSFTIRTGETLGVIGESGSGKSTLARLAAALLSPTAGSVYLHGDHLDGRTPSELRSLRSKIQVVFQEPLQSLNPAMSVKDTLSEPLRVHTQLGARDRERRVYDVLVEVGLSEDILPRRPRQLSGGQQQRVGIARAIMTRPSVVVLDEPTSSLDLPLQVQILRLLRRLQADHGLAYLFISHDINCVAAIADKIAVMHNGTVVEAGLASQIIASPSDDYSRLLLSARIGLPKWSRRQLPEPGSRAWEDNR